MENELSTVIYKINFKYILKNYLNKSLWKKQWTIFDYNNVVIKMQLSSIDIRWNRIDLRLSSDYVITSMDLPLAEDHFNETVFTKELFRKLVSMAETIEEVKIRRLAVYDSAQLLDEALREQREQIANEFLDANKVTNEAIREAYVDSFMANFTEYLNRNRVIENFKHRVAPEIFLMLALQYDRKDFYDEIIDQLEEEDVDSITANLTEDFESIDVEDMADSKKYLDTILGGD